MNRCRELMRRKLLEEMYDKMTPEDKRAFIQLTMKDQGHEEILQALQNQDRKLDEITRRQSWWLDLSSNVAGNAMWDGAAWLFSKILRRL